VMNNAPIISIQNITVQYTDAATVLKDITVHLYGGRICGLIGMNGSGKSTLFKCIMGLLKPSYGNILIGGVDIRSSFPKNRIAYVPQSEEVDWDFPILVEEVVMMGRFGHMGFFRRPSSKDYAAVHEALEKVQLAAFKKRQIGELSGGQKKRVFVARALAQNSDIFLLDEPFSGVDTSTEESLIDLFKELSNQGKLIIVSTHNLGSVPYFCHEVMLLNQRLLAHGPVKTTFTQSYLKETFGGMLRHHKLGPDTIHSDEDQRSVAVITDDERPVVFYGEESAWNIIKGEHSDSKEDHSSETQT
jgi:manganese/iron transport system ATP-binding protein